MANWKILENNTRNKQITSFYPFGPGTWKEAQKARRSLVDEKQEGEAFSRRNFIFVWQKRTKNQKLSKKISFRASGCFSESIFQSDLQISWLDFTCDDDQLFTRVHAVRLTVRDIVGLKFEKKIEKGWNFLVKKVKNL